LPDERAGRGSKMRVATMPNSKDLVVLEGPSRPIGRRKPAPLVLALLALTGLAGVSVLALVWTRPPPPGGAAAISVAPVIVAVPWSKTPLPIQLGPPEAIPKGGWIRIDGLPPVAALSEGHVTRLGSWIVPLSKLPMLKVTAPPSEGAMPEIAIALIAPDGEVLAEARSLLAVVATLGDPPVPGTW